MKNVFFAFLFLLCSSAIAKTYYVDMNKAGASDANLGTMVSPWKTIKKAAATLVAGETVFVAAGVYDERDTLKTSGTASGKIYFKAATPRSVVNKGFQVNGSHIRLEGFDVYHTSIGYTAVISNRGSYVDIINNNIEYADWAGINTGSNAHHVTIRNNRVYGCGFGIIVSDGSNVLVENNEVDRLIFKGLDDADYSRAWGDTITFRGNYFHGNKWVDLDDFPSNNPHVDGFQTFFGGIQNLLFENNWVEAFHEGAMIEGTTDNSAPAKNLMFRNNVYIGDPGWGGGSAWGVCVKSNTYVLNVSVYNNMFKDIQWNAVGIGATCTGTAKNNIMYNIISGDYGKAYSAPGGHNMLYHPAKTEAKVNTTDIIQNPQFVNVANGIGPDSLPFTVDDGLRLKSTSPAIDTGESLSSIFSFDAYGTARPQGAGWDIGAHEYSANTPVIETRQENGDRFTFSDRDFAIVSARSLQKGFSARFPGAIVYDITGKTVKVKNGSNIRNGIYFVKTGTWDCPHKLFVME